jgi:hypothetical protein
MKTMLRLTTYLFLLSALSTLLTMPASAQPVVDAEGGMPPPPGPYLSSRPQLELNNVPQRNTNRIPFVGSMPSMPMRNMPMPNMPNQFPASPQWWHGPMMGR